MKDTLKKLYKSFYYTCHGISRFVQNYIDVKRNKNILNDLPKAFFIIKDFNDGKYGYQLLNYVNSCGYQVVIVQSNDFLYRLHFYDRLIFSIPNLYLCKKYTFPVSESDIGFVVNADRRVLHRMNVLKVFDVNFDYFNNAGIEGTLSVPYYVHPSIAKHLAETNHRGRKKNGGILFYGAGELLYTDKYVLHFKKISRDRLFKILLSSGIDLLYPKSYEEFSAILNNNVQNKVVIYDDSVFRVPVSEWLNTLSKFHFFLAGPGLMPICHNLLEAMSVGTVPIIQFPELIVPPLKDNENCIAFKDENDLLMKITDALNLEYAVKEKLSDGVFDYFANNVAPGSFRKKVEALESGCYDLYMNAEDSSLKYIEL